MSKEQTPITAEEWSIEEHIKALLVLRGFSKEYILNNRGVIGAVIEDMEQYAQAKVLEVLEREVVEARMTAPTDKVIREKWDYSTSDEALNYYETEVKPKYT